VAGEERVKTAIWLYLFLFVAFFDLHAQYPILSPFALSLGAAPSFIGLIMGVYSITHLPGNLLAGYGVDRFGSRLFIAFSLIGAGLLLLFQAQVTDPWQLLVVRSISGFVLAFLSPACSSLLAKLAKDHVMQGKLMAGNGLVHTLASVVSPAAGAYLVSKFGFTQSFVVLGWVLMATGAFALFGIRDRNADELAIDESSKDSLDGHSHKRALEGHAGIPHTLEHQPIPWLFFIVPLAISCSQGILFFELPLMKESLDSILTSGILFSMVSLGALITLSMLFLARLSPFLRTAFGSLALALTFFGMAIRWPIPIEISLILIGLAKGVIYPAISTLLITITSASRYGRVFSLLSIAFSIGAFFGPILAGQARDHISPYFIAFLVLMTALAFLAPTRSMTWRSANARS
jgi:MFS family permease